jgi:hypothetical protein
MPARFAGWKPVLRRLTPLRVTVTISDEYRTRPLRAAFDSKTHANEGIPQWRDNGAFESTPHD